MKELVLTLTAMLTTVFVSAKTLVVYYSFTNNVHTIVNRLQAQTGADVLRIEPARR